MTASFPALRLRRTRIAPWSRRMVAETVLTPADLIWPLFVTEGRGVEEPIATLPGVSRWSVDGIVARAREATRSRHPVHRAVPQHAAAPAQRRWREALNPDNLMCRAIRAIKRRRARDRRAHRRRARPLYRATAMTG